MPRKKKKRRGPLKFPKFMQKKLLAMFAIIAVLLVGLIARLMYIDETSGEKYEKIVLSQQSYDSQTIPYQRGDIVDSSGTVLATSIAVYNVILDCSVMTAKDDYIEPTISALLECFPDLTSEQLYGYARDRSDSMYIVLEKKVSYEDIQPFVAMQEAVDDDGNKVNPYIKGVWFETDYEREYPYGSLASAVIGFTTSGNLGINGLEYYYNDTLNGTNGREYGYLNSDNAVEKTVKDAVNGDTIVTTIDANIQAIVEEKIAEFNEAYTGAYREDDAGATHIGVVIMDPNNGDVLAMANYPNYDLSNPRDLSAYYTEEEIAEMDDDDKLTALNTLWQNFCVSYTYEPGSTAKPFTVAAGLETGTLTGDETFFCDGSETISGYKISCVSRYGHGELSVEGALMESCNDCLMQMSYLIGTKNFTDYQEIFGFGQKTNIDLPGEARTDSLIYTYDRMTTLDLATNSFGQNFNTTMIQLATAYCSLVNGGYMYQPRVVSRIEDADGNTVEEISPTLLRQTVSKTTSDTLKEYMYETVNSGTAAAVKVDGYSMGGKTGTAQKAGRDGVNYLVSFIGFAPMDDPQLVIYCVIDEPNAAEQSHSTFALNLSREILEEVLPYMNIYRDEESTGIHAGWDITGTDTGAVAMTDIVNSEDEAEEEGDLFDETGLVDIPYTMDDMDGGESDAEADSDDEEDDGEATDSGGENTDVDVVE